MKIFCGHRSKDNVWFRVFGFGLFFTKTPPLFSERRGYRKRLRLPFGWRAEVLKRKKWRKREWDDGLGALMPGDRLIGMYDDAIFPVETFDSNSPTFFVPLRIQPHIRCEVDIPRGEIIYADTGVYEAVYTMGWPGVIRRTENGMELLLDDDHKNQA